MKKEKKKKDISSMQKKGACISVSILTVHKETAWGEQSLTLLQVKVANYNLLAKTHYVYTLDLRNLLNAFPSS